MGTVRVSLTDGRPSISRGMLMNRIVLSASLLAACLAPQASGQGQPKGPPPRVMVAAVDATGQAYIRQVVQELVPEQRQVQVQVGGKAVVQTQTVLVPVLKTIQVSLDGPGVEVFDSDGKRIEP